jgi:Protein tyrosine and serine/threonine kinase/Calx-beta domain
VRPVSNGALRDKKMIDPTETQPLPWRAHEARRRPWAEQTVDLPGSQPEGRDASLPDRLADRGYRLRSRLGSGRLGAIYEAQDDLSRSSGSQHFVAIQLIDDRIVTRPDFAADFERGARELQTLSHPNIAKLLEYGCDANRYYLVWELLESASLRFVLNDTPTLPVEETSAVLRALGDALLHLHAKGIVHGNLKAENVLVTFGYEVKLLDIVPSGWLDNPADDLGVPARTPHKRDDVFGLACLGYEMLAGRHPYNGNTAQEAYRAGLEAAPISGLSSRQWRALAGALAVHRDDRTPNVAQFLEEFGATQVERLKSVVEAAAVPEEPPARPPERARQAPAFDHAPYEPAPYEPAPYEHAPGPRVVVERPAAYEPGRSGAFGKLALFVLVLVAGALLYLYQDPLREGLSGLTGGTASDVEPQTVPATETAEPAEPLARTEPITDPEPATVVAPGAERSASDRPAAEAPAPETSAPETPAPAAPPAATTAEERAPSALAAVPQATAPDAAAIETPAASAGPTRFSFTQSVATVRESDVAARIVIHRSGDLSGTADVAWWTGEDSAKAEQDYADLGARVERFEPGERNRTVFVPLTNDAIAEPGKSFQVFLGHGESAREGEPASGMRVEILDDD